MSTSSLDTPVRSTWKNCFDVSRGPIRIRRKTHFDALQCDTDHAPVNSIFPIRHVQFEKLV